VTRRVVLASASPARLALLRTAGLAPEVVVSGVDEDQVRTPDTASTVAELARRKAEAVAERCGDALVIGCDSLLDVDGRGCGKPATTADALAQWRLIRGRSATLFTGHCLIDTQSGARATGVEATTIRFGTPSDAEIEAYVATGEPLAVAGGFTIEGRGAPFVDGIDGDASNVIGLSLPLLRRLFAEVGVAITDLWG
jgi:septum formation protein